MLHYIIWLLILILYSPTFFTLYHSAWKVRDYTHAYFILPISLWLVWRKRSILKDLPQSPNTLQPITTILSLIIFLLGVFLFIFGWRWDYLVISTFSLIPVLYGLIIYLYGGSVAKVLSFPILYLLLLVPPPLGILDNATLPMRYGISVATEAILKLLHYPITREGLLLSIGGHEIFMGQPCSGFRSLITMFALALVYVYISKVNLSKKSILVISIVPLALLGNLIRITSVCLVTYYWGESIGQKFFHDFSGIVIFVIMILGLIGIETLLDKKEKKVKG